MSMVPAGNSDLAEVDGIPEGLEDFDPSDLGMPVIRIDGKLKPRPWLAEGQTGPAFVDAASGMEWASLENIVAMGMLKQRVLWPANMGESDVPLCRSFDGQTGAPTDGKFPWGATPDFDRNALKTGEKEGSEPGSILNVFSAPCEHCPLKEWGTHPSKDAPWCTLQHCYPVLVPQGDRWVSALLVLQRSSIKPSNNYIGGFSRARQPMYTVYTTITLDPRTKGSTDYAVPVLKRGAATPTDDYPFFSEKFRGIKEFVRSPRGFDDAASASEDAPEAGITTDPQPVPHPAAQQPVAQQPVAQQPVAQQPVAQQPPPPTTAPTPSPASSPAVTAPASTPAAETPAPSEPPRPVWDGASGQWIQPVFNATSGVWEFPAPSAPPAPPAPVTAPAVVEDDPFAEDAPATPPATPVAVTAPAPTPVAAGAAVDDDDIPF